MQNFDIIGDIHGYASALKNILDMLGYKEVNGTYTHAFKKVIFLGDYIDRGPEIKETLKIVKSMVDNNMAFAVMGNHEYNAIGYNLPDGKGGFLRSRNKANTHQHIDTLNQFKGQEDLYNQYIDWFKTLPLYIDFNSCRVVHASWDLNAINFLENETNFTGVLSDQDLKDSFNETLDLHKAVEIVLKGKEINLPNGYFFTDKDGKIRSSIRIKWWEKFNNPTINDLSVLALDIDYFEPLNFASDCYEANDKPVFFGHYWLIGLPKLLKDNVCCLDYSIAKNGLLAAYTFRGEKKLNPLQFSYAK